MTEDPEDYENTRSHNDDDDDVNNILFTDIHSTARLAKVELDDMHSLQKRILVLLDVGAHTGEYDENGAVALGTLRRSVGCKL